MAETVNDQVPIDAIQEPPPAHVDEDGDESQDEREATELRDLNNIRASLPHLSHILTSGEPSVLWYDPVKKFWRHHVRISVPHVDCRDHLANERTFLGYLRSSVTLSVVGVTIAQLYRLDHPPDPSGVFGYYVLSKPLSAIFQSAALVVVIVGGFRFWRQQNALAVGKVHAGGWEISVIGAGIALLLVTMFVLHIGIFIYQDDQG